MPQKEIIMKGIKSKVITDEETVRMHTNFAKFDRVSVWQAKKGNASWELDNDKGILKLHIAVQRGYTFVFLSIPELTLGKKYGTSVCIKTENRMPVYLCMMKVTAESRQKGYKAWKDGDKHITYFEIVSAPNQVGLYISPFQDNTDYELSDFRVWEIDDETGGAIVRFLSAVILNLAYAGRKEAA